MNLCELTLVQASAGLRRREFSVSELVASCQDAIRESDGTLHAYLDVFDDAMAQAKKADEMFADAKGRDAAPAHLPPLLGIPLAIKDNILIEGRRCTAASRMLENYTASYDATVIQKLKNQGAVFLGKTNMDDAAMGSSTESSFFGPTKNPRDPTRVPGGSSGGSAAAVAADMCMGAFGSDTGGSIRQPASFCGVVGVKPTYGAVSRHGLIAMASSLDVIGPLAKTVEDAEILFRAIAGGDDFDATAVSQTYNLQPTTYNLRNLRIGVPKEYFGEGLDSGVERVIRSAIQKMESAGAEIHEISLPHSRYALPAYYIIVPSEVSANLARLDGIRYGYHDFQGETSSDVYARSRAGGFGPEIKRRIMLGTYVLSAGYYDAYYLKAQQVRQLIRNDFMEAFKKVDMIAGPTTPTPAFFLGERAGDPLAMYLADMYTVAVNLAGLPALSMPAGDAAWQGAKLPVGLQLIAPWFAESRLFEAGRAIEDILR